MQPLSAAPASYYDGLLDDPRNAYGLPLEESPYRELYERGADLVPEGLNVVELGSGSGRFASLVIPKCATYLGIDFSVTLTAEAIEYNGHSDCFWLHDFVQGDIPENADVYVLMEVLEHLDDDLGLLERLPSGALVVCSVPSFDSFSHVRVFPSERDVRSRYAEVLDMDVDIQRIDRPAVRRGACRVAVIPRFYLWAARRP